jgi:hypothetical protein
MSSRRNVQLPSKKVRPISRVPVFNPSKGINNQGSPNLIDDREWSDLLNVEFDEGGVVRKRMGYTTFADSLTDARGLGELSTDSVNHLCTIDGDTFKYTSGSTWASNTSITFTPGKEVSMTQARAKTYVWNGDQGGAEWDGSTLARPGTMPKAKFSIFYSSYHIAAGVDGQSSRVYVSRLANASIFTNGSTTLNNSTEVPGATVFDGSGANFIDIQREDGDRITGLGIFQDQVIIFKQFAIYQLSFDDSGDPVVLPVTRAAGCVSHRTIVSVENDLYFLARDGVRFLGNEPNYFSSIRTNILSRAIEPIIKRINPSHYAKSSAVYFNNQYILSVPTTSADIDTTLSYHKEFKGWSVWRNVDSDSYAQFVDSGNNLKLVWMSDTGDQAYEFTPGVYTDNGQPIRAYLLSKVFDFKNPDITKYFVDLGLMFRTISGEIDLELYTEGNVLFGGQVGIAGNPVTDGMGITMLGEHMLGTGGGVPGTSEAFADTVRRIVIKTRSTTIRFRLENNRNNENFVLLGYIHAFYPYSHFLFDSAKKIYL